MSIEYAIEDKLNPSWPTSLKDLGGLFLEFYYHVLQLPLAARSLREYIRESKKPEVKERMRENVFNSLVKKGYSSERVKDELNRIIF